jgi:hypothetical protein
MSKHLQVICLSLLTAGALIVGPNLGASAQAPTASPGTLLFNAQVNATAPAPPASRVDNFPQNKQNEPSIIRDPATGVLIAGSNDEIDEPLCTGSGTAGSPGSCPFVAGVGNSGVYISTNSGESWTQPAFPNQCGATIHTLPGYCQQNLESFGDPILAVGPALPSCRLGSGGNVIYYGNLAFPTRSAMPVVAVSRSLTDGAGWLSPVVASSTTNPVDFNDKDYVWADNNPKSPFYGNVYVSWTLFQGAGRFGKSATFSPEPIVFARSTDCGATWSSAMRLSQSANNGFVGGRQGSLIRTGPDGTVYVFWEGSIFHHSEQLVAISHDGGVSFSRPIPVAAVTDIPSPLAGSSFRDDSFPTADVNPVTGSLYLAWANLDTASNTALIQFTESDNGGLTWNTPVTIGGTAGKFNAFFPGLAASPDGRHVFIGWPAQTWQPTGTAAGPSVVSQFAAYNLLTVGAGFGGPHLLSTASGDPDGSSTNALGGQFLGDYATAVASNTTGAFVWTDTRNETPCAAVDAFRAGTTTLEPNPDLSCPASNTGQLFGNSDIFLGAVNF